MAKRAFDYLRAVDDFHKARRRASLEQLLAQFTGQPAALLSYETVRQQLHGLERPGRTLQSIPMEKIIGSVDRYHDFTRSFLPLMEEDSHRWATVELAVTSLQGVPAIEVYQIGDAYFVRDGHHRVSVARRAEQTHIDAYVTPVETRVELSADDRAVDLILKSELSDFLEATGLDESRPNRSFDTTVPGQYVWLLTEIESFRKENLPGAALAAAAEAWHDRQYAPVVEYIDRRGLLRDFPDRTSTDLYIWILRRRAELITDLGVEIDPNAVAADLAARTGGGLGQSVAETLVPSALREGPPVGEWRQERLDDTGDSRLFRHILVALDGSVACWAALTEALYLAQLENGRIIGLHVADNERAAGDAFVSGIRTTFAARCRAAKVRHDFVVESGPVIEAICFLARFLDMVVISLSHPPGTKVVDRLSSGVSQLIRRSPRPVLAVPNTPTRPKRLLLAYDGHPKAREALFIAVYMAGRWEAELEVVCVKSPAAVKEARAYLDNHRVTAVIHEIDDEPAAGAITRLGRERGIDLILIGGYSGRSWRSIVLGSTVDEVLRTRNRSVLICR